MSEPRSKPIQFWATVAEWELIRAAAQTTEARSLSDYVRGIVLRDAAAVTQEVHVRLPRADAAALVAQHAGAST